jgi:hypothetical protein
MLSNVRRHRWFGRVSYASDGTVLGIEILSPRRRGVLLDGLPYRDDVARVMRSVGFRIRHSARPEA